jgi:hypothetical protein
VPRIAVYEDDIITLSSPNHWKRSLPSLHLIYSFTLWKRLPRFLVEHVRTVGQPSCEGAKALAGQVDPTSEESEEEEGFVEVNLGDIVF